MTINIRGIQGTFILKYPRSEKNQARAKSRIITANAGNFLFIIPKGITSI